MFGERIPPVLARLIDDEPESGPLHRQFCLDPREQTVTPHESIDPLHERRYSPLPRLVHRYPNRVVVLITDRCAVHCRYCFRRTFVASEGPRPHTITTTEQQAIADYLRDHVEVQEVLLTGGDALMVRRTRMLALVDALRDARPGIIVRIATRVPTAMPDLVTAELIAGLRARSPVWVVCQINHTAELTLPGRSALARLLDAGVPVVSQTVLLAGVNDNVDELSTLFESLVALRIKPYYLFQPDLVAGTSHFRVDLADAVALVSQLRRTVSGLAMPTFAVDAPGGGGKVVLEPSAIIGDEHDAYVLRGIDGRTYRYPKSR